MIGMLNVLLSFDMNLKPLSLTNLLYKKLVDCEWNICIYKSLKISIRTVMRNLEMLKFVPGHLK